MGLSSKSFPAIVIFLLFPSFIVAQEWNDTIRKDPCTFENPCSHVIIDSAGNNAWEIGHPGKAYFDSAYSGEKAIMTDTSQPYDTNQLACFELVIPNGRKGLLSTNTYLTFQHKYEAAKAKDGGFLKFSFDGGTSFSGFHQAEAFYEGSHIDGRNLYDEDDTLASGTPAFTGSSDWEKVSIGWQNYIPVKRIADTILVRFCFKTDSISEEKAGWMIDDIETGSYNIPNVAESQKNIPVQIGPNPVKSRLQVHTSRAFQGSPLTLKLYTANGRLLKTSAIEQGETFPVAEYDPGLYFLEIQTDQSSYFRRIVIE